MLQEEETPTTTVEAAYAEKSQNVPARCRLSESRLPASAKAGLISRAADSGKPGRLQRSSLVGALEEAAHETHLPAGDLPSALDTHIYSLSVLFTLLSSLVFKLQWLIDS